MTQEQWHQSQRGYFAGALHDIMEKDDRVWLLTGDLGFGMLDKIRDDFPDRFLNCGASEQAMCGIAVGLALEGKVPFVYTISSFMMRMAETIGLYLDGEQVPVHWVGSGRDNDYKHDGLSHDGTMAQNFLKGLRIEQYYPETKEEVPNMVAQMLNNRKPSFLSLKR
jgi:transketolase